MIKLEGCVEGELELAYPLPTRGVPRCGQCHPPTTRGCARITPLSRSLGREVWLDPVSHPGSFSAFPWGSCHQHCPLGLCSGPYFPHLSLSWPSQMR